MFGFFIFTRPEQIFMAGGKIFARKVGTGVGFEPGDVVEDVIVKQQHGKTAGQNAVIGAGDPNGAIGFEQAFAQAQPLFVELKVLFNAVAFVPLAFIDFDQFAVLAAGAAARNHIRRVGEYHIKRVFGQGGQNLETIVIIKLISVSHKTLGTSCYAVMLGGFAVECNGFMAIIQ